MNQEQDLMSVMKRLKRVDQEGGSMTTEERILFEVKKVESKRLEAKAKESINNTILIK